MPFSFKQLKANRLKRLPEVLNSTEKKVFLVLVTLFVLSGLSVFSQWLYSKSAIVPATNGEYIEGLVGSPIYVNPILAQTNDVDLDLSSLIFSSLLKYDKNQNLIDDLAESYTVSDDQTTYTFKIRSAAWQDSEPVTADDVIFTIKTIQDAQYKSPLYLSLQGVDVQKIDDHNFKLILKKPFAPFPTLLTFGILPEHIWSGIQPSTFSLAEYNIKPIGSGAWQFKSLAKDKQGIIKTYSLARNAHYYGAMPNLDKLTFKFYAGQDELLAAAASKEILGINYVSKSNEDNLPKTLDTFSLKLPQYTALFLNQKKNDFLKDLSVRKALALAINRSELVTQALNEDGDVIDGPILPGFLGYNVDIDGYDFNLDQARKTLDSAGWKEISADDYVKFVADQKVKAALSQSKKGKANPSTTPETTNAPVDTGGQATFRKKQNDILALNLTTVSTTENQKVAELIAGYWRALGIKVDVALVDPNRIAKDAIQPRNYDVLLYGEVIGSDPDLFPFWHSSQSDAPGLNLAQFADKDTDRLLVDARETVDPKKRDTDYQQFQDILSKQLPAIFLYSPTYTYALDKRVKGFSVDKINTPSDRFSNLNDWYLKTKRVFKF